MSLLENIDDYLNEGLSGEEKSSFEKEIKSDRKVSRALEDQESLQEDIELFFHNDFNKKLQAWEQEARTGEVAPLSTTTETTERTETKEPVVRKLEPTTSRRGWLKYAAVALLFMGPLWFVSQMGVDNQKLYEQYAHFPNTNNNRVRGVNKEIGDAERAFDNRDFKKAANIFEEAGEKQIKNNLYYGISLISIDRHEKGREVLRNIAIDKKRDDGDRNFAKFWNALSYVKEENNAEAIKALKKIIKEKGLLLNQAEDLLKKLE